MLEFPRSGIPLVIGGSSAIDIGDITSLSFELFTKFPKEAVGGETASKARSRDRTPLVYYRTTERAEDER